MKKYIFGILLAMVGIIPNGYAQKIDPDLQAALTSAATGRSLTKGILVLSDQVDVPALTQSLTAAETTREQTHEYVVRSLQATAAQSQQALLARLRQLKVQGATLQSFTPLWIVNAIIIEAEPTVFYEMSSRSDVQGLYLDYPVSTILPVEQAEPPSTITTIEQGITLINAHLLWQQGITGQGRLVGHLDTGVDGTHPSLTNKWRGRRSGVTPQSAWFDPLTNTTAPFDSGSHGTHTMGTIVGHVPGDTIGVAYGAEWISAGVIDRGGIEATIQNALLALQWMADPDGNPATVNDVPDVCSNSWGIPLSIRPGCDQTFWQAIDNLEAATVVVVFAAGNEGRSGAQTLRTPSDRNTTPTNTFSVGALGTDGQIIADYSSRGPSACPGTDAQRIKPEIVARGSSVRSALPGNRYGLLSGTSMATPHVAGAVVLLRQVSPNATVEQIKLALMGTATDLGAAGEDNVYGHGRINVFAAAERLRSTGCPANQTVTQTILSGQNLTFQASSQLTATNIIQSGATATYRAGSRVVLQPGFRAAAGSNLRVRIQACTAREAAAMPVLAARLTPAQSQQLVSESDKVVVYPNPNSGMFTIALTDAHATGEFEMYNLAGVRVHAGKLRTPQKEVNLSRLPKGVYLLKVITDGQLQTKKVILE